MTDSVLDKKVHGWIDHAMYSEMTTNAIEGIKQSWEQSSDDTKSVEYAAYLGAEISQNENVPNKGVLCSQLNEAIETSRDYDLRAEQKVSLLDDLKMGSMNYSQKIVDELEKIGIGNGKIEKNRPLPI